MRLLRIIVGGLIAAIVVVAGLIAAAVVALVLFFRRLLRPADSSRVPASRAETGASFANG